MSELITVPMFTFNQGDIFSGSENAERPIKVLFYNGSIELQQDGLYDQPEKILISTNFLDKLFKEIKKQLPEAQVFLKR